MVAVTRLFADQQGHARFEDIEIPLAPGDPPPDVMSVSQPWQASAVLFGRGPAGGSHGEQPEHRRQLVVGISGRVEVTATGETRTFGPGDVLLVEDTEGFGHSSQSSEGFVAAFVLLEPPARPEPPVRPEPSVPIWYPRQDATALLHYGAHADAAAPRSTSQRPRRRGR